jgi:hypothetical protein
MYGNFQKGKKARPTVRWSRENHYRRHTKWYERWLRGDSTKSSGGVYNWDGLMPVSEFEREFLNLLKLYDTTVFNPDKLGADLLVDHFVNMERFVSKYKDLEMQDLKDHQETMGTLQVQARDLQVQARDKVSEFRKELWNAVKALTLVLLCIAAIILAPSKVLMGAAAVAVVDIAYQGYIGLQGAKSDAEIRGEKLNIADYQRIALDALRHPVDPVLKGLVKLKEAILGHNGRKNLWGRWNDSTEAQRKVKEAQQKVKEAQREVKRYEPGEEDIQDLFHTKGLVPAENQEVIDALERIGTAIQEKLEANEPLRKAVDEKKRKRPN